jgi:hypothetical protein
MFASIKEDVNHVTPFTVLDRCIAAADRRTCLATAPSR